MKASKKTHQILILSALLISPGLVLAEESLWDKAKESTSQGWEATRKGAKDATEWSKEKSVEAWDATKEGASDASEWTREKAGKAWDATREGTADAIDALKGKDDESAKEGRRDSRVF